MIGESAHGSDGLSRTLHQEPILDEPRFDCGNRSLSGGVTSENTAGAQREACLASGGTAHQTSFLPGADRCVLGVPPAVAPRAGWPQPPGQAWRVNTLARTAPWAACAPCFRTSRGRRHRMPGQDAMPPITENVPVVVQSACNLLPKSFVENCQEGIPC